MKKVLLFFVAVLIGSFAFGQQNPKDRVLVFSKTAGFRHASIKDGIAVIQKLGLEHNFAVDTTENTALFTDENLKKYKALVFLNPTGSNLFNDSQKAAFKNYINHGGGFAGIHAAADCSYEWEWYGRMAGAFFKNHPKIQEARLNVVNRKHPASRRLPPIWRHKDEWYNFKDINKDVKVLITLDESSYEGGENGSFHPASWYHEFDGGRAFYTVLGHRPENYTDKLFLSHLLGGIEYAMGRKKIKN